MNLYAKVEEYFASSSNYISIKNLAKKLDISLNDLEELSEVLYTLEKEGKIMGTDKSEYVHVPKDFYLLCGKVNLSSQNNFYIKLPRGAKVIIEGRNLQKYLKDGDTVFVETRKSKHSKLLVGSIKRIVSRPKINKQRFLFKAELKKSNNHNTFYAEFYGKKYYIKNLNGAYVGDLVTLDGYHEDGAYFADVKEVLMRKTNQHVFEYKDIGGIYKWIPIGTTSFDINCSFKPEDYTEGDRVLFEIDDNNNAKMIKKLDNSDSISSSIKAQAYDNGFNVDFSKGAMDEAEDIKRDITDEDIKERLDLRYLDTVTIDSSTAKDLDDAISLEKLSDRYRLYVSIADVSHYVKPGMKLFEEALDRGTSIYPANLVIPMLPTKLSNDVCSLSPNTDKLTKTCIVDIDFKGNIIDSKVVKSIINSNYKMHYSKVNDILLVNKVHPDYEPFRELIKNMNDLSNILQKRREERGYISFESEELGFEFDLNGEISGIKYKDKGPAQVMIENFMLVANECIADYAHNLDVPFIYRNHEYPNVEKLFQLKFKLQDFRKYLNSLSKAQNPKVMQKIIKVMFKDKSDYEKDFLSKIFLQSMSRAIYSSSNMGHYGLALDCYATFTSPIRRMPDLLNHLVLDYIIEGKYDELDKFIDLYAEWAYLCTERQQESERFEDSISGMLLQKYASDYYGKSLNGRIVFIYSDFVYVDTDVGFYGYFKIPKKNIKNGVIIIEGKQYKIGSNIEVMIENINTLTNEIEFTTDKNQAKRLIKK